MQTEEEIKSSSASSRMVRLVTDTLFFGILFALSKVPLLILLPITTRLLSVEEYGVMDLFTIFGATVSIIAYFGQEDAVGRHYYEESANGKKQIISSALLITVVASVMLITIGGIFAEPILIKLIGTAKYRHEYMILLSYIPFLATLHILRTAARWTFKRATFTILNACPAVLLLALAYLFLVHMKLGIAGVFYAQLISSTTFLAIGLFLMRSLITIHIGIRKIKVMLRYGVFVMLVASLSSYLFVMDKSAYASLFGLDTLGQYTFAARYATISALTIWALNAAWAPMLYIVHNSSDRDKTFNKTFYTVGGLMALSMFIQISLAEPFIWYIVPHEYIASLKFIPVLTLAQYIIGLSAVASIGIALSTRVEYAIIPYIPGYFVFNIVATTLNNKLGELAIAYALLIAIITICALTILIAYKLYPARFKLITPFALLGISFIFCAVFRAMPQTIVIQIAARVILLCMLMAIVWRTAVHKDDRKKLLSKLLSFRA